MNGVTRSLRWLPLAALLACAPTALAWAEEPGHAGEAVAHTDAEHGEGEAEGHHGGFDAKKFGFQLFNFGVLVFILVKFGGSAMNKRLAARHVQLKKDIEEAAAARAAAEKRLAEQE